MATSLLTLSEPIFSTPFSWAAFASFVWIAYVFRRGWTSMNVWDRRQAVWGVLSIVSFLHYLQLDPEFEGWGDVYFFCGRDLRYCTCNFRWNLLGWCKALVLWSFVLSTALGVQRFAIEVGLGGLLPGEEVVTKESFISICWRLIPYWLNNWEQQWGAECSSMTFELPHFAMELLVILPCVQVLCSRLKILATPLVNVAAPVPGQAPEEFVRDNYAPNIIKGYWEYDPRQRQLLGRLKFNTRIMFFTLVITSLAAFNALCVPLLLERQIGYHPSTLGVKLAGQQLDLHNSSSSSNNSSSSSSSHTSSLSSGAYSIQNNFTNSSLGEMPVLTAALNESVVQMAAEVEVEEPSQLLLPLPGGIYQLLSTQGRDLLVFRLKRYSSPQGPLPEDATEVGSTAEVAAAAAQSCGSVKALKDNLRKHAAEIAKMNDAEHMTLIPLVESALAIMRLSCEKYFVLVSVFVSYILFRDPPTAARVIIRINSRLSTAFQKVILYSFPAVCWVYGAGFIFSTFVSVVFWGGPIIGFYESLRSAISIVRIRALHAANATEIERMGGNCAICWGDMTEGPCNPASAESADSAQGQPPPTGPGPGPGPDGAAAGEEPLGAAPTAGPRSTEAPPAEAGAGVIGAAKDAAPIATAGSMEPFCGTAAAAVASPAAAAAGAAADLAGISSSDDADAGNGSATLALRTLNGSLHYDGSSSAGVSPLGQLGPASEEGGQATGHRLSPGGPPSQAPLLGTARASVPNGVPGANRSGTGESNTGDMWGSGVQLPPACGQPLAGPSSQLVIDAPPAQGGQATPSSERTEGAAPPADAAAVPLGAAAAVPLDAGVVALHIPPPPAHRRSNSTTGSLSSATGGGSAQGFSLPCGHAYHHACLTQWLHQCHTQSVSPTCPMCQVDIQLEVRWRFPYPWRQPVDQLAGNGAEAPPVPHMERDDMRLHRRRNRPQLHLQAGLQIIGMLEHQRELQELLMDMPNMPGAQDLLQHPDDGEDEGEGEEQDAAVGDAGFVVDPIVEENVDVPPDPQPPVPEAPLVPRPPQGPVRVLDASQAPLVLAPVQDGEPGPGAEPATGGSAFRGGNATSASALLVPAGTINPSTDDVGPSGSSPNLEGLLAEKQRLQDSLAHKRETMRVCQEHLQVHQESLRFYQDAQKTSVREERELQQQYKQVVQKLKKLQGKGGGGGGSGSTASLSELGTAAASSNTSMSEQATAAAGNTVAGQAPRGDASDTADADAPTPAAAAAAAAVARVAQMHSLSALPASAADALPALPSLTLPSLPAAAVAVKVESTPRALVLSAGSGPSGSHREVPAVVAGPPGMSGMAGPPNLGHLPPPHTPTADGSQCSADTASAAALPRTLSQAFIRSLGNYCSQTFSTDTNARQQTAPTLTFLPCAPTPTSESEFAPSHAQAQSQSLASSLSSVSAAPSSGGTAATASGTGGTAAAASGTANGTTAARGGTATTATSAASPSVSGTGPSRLVSWLSSAPGADSRVPQGEVVDGLAVAPAPLGSGQGAAAAVAAPAAPSARSRRKFLVFKRKQNKAKPL